MKNFIAPGFRSKNYEERFYSKVEKSDGCWKWLGAKDLYGYGRFLFNGNNTQAHRIAWIIVNGDIPEGLHVLHTCDNPPRTNPAHLWLGTNKDNTADKVKKNRCNTFPSIHMWNVRSQEQFRSLCGKHCIGPRLTNRWLETTCLRCLAKRKK